MTLAEDRADVVVIGGGLAGITAAIELADAGYEVTLIESRPWLGGATCSFTRRGLTIDNGQHVFLRCCTAYRDLLARLRVTTSCDIQQRLDLTVLAAGGRPGAAVHARVRRSALPSPLHLVRALAGYRLLSVAERARVAAAAVTLQFADLGGGDDRSLAGWLVEHGQDERARSMFWDWLCVAAVNVPPERADLGLAASAIRTALLAGRDHADIGVPSVPLSSLHGGPAAELLARLGVTIRLGARAVAVQPGQAGGYLVSVTEAADADGPVQVAEEIRAAGVVLAVPPGEAAALAPAGLAADAARWSRLRPSPVVSVHVMYGSRVTRLPFAAVTGSPVRWVIDKTSAAGLYGGQYLAASLPAADSYVDMPAARIRELVLPLLARLFPAAAGAGVEDVFVTRERRATIRHEPGAWRLRTGPTVSVPGIAVAGGWTDTGWPDTMEGAVRSGRSAAARLIADLAGRGHIAAASDTAASDIAAPSDGVAAAAAPSPGRP